MFMNIRVYDIIRVKRDISPTLHPQPATTNPTLPPHTYVNKCQIVVPLSILNPIGKDTHLLTRQTAIHAPNFNAVENDTSDRDNAIYGPTKASEITRYLNQHSLSGTTSNHFYLK